MDKWKFKGGRVIWTPWIYPLDHIMARNNLKIKISMHGWNIVNTCWVLVNSLKSRQRFEMTSPGLPFLIAAPTGAGKTTLVTNALETLKENFPIERMVTYTTRPVRQNEVDGIDYHFVTKEKFLELQSQNHFFEVRFFCLTFS